MQVRCTIIADIGPSEAIVEIVTNDGTEELILQRRLVQSGAVEVGGVIFSQGEYSLIELPQETTSGKWRVWVPQGEVLQAA